MTDTIAHPPLPEPAGHVFTHIMEAFAKVDCHGHIYSLPQSDPVYGSTVPLYTAQQMREYRDAPAWLPIKTAPRDTNMLVGRFVGDEWRICQSIFFFDSGNELDGEPSCWCWACDFDSGGVTDDEGPSHWMPLPAAPIEQADGDKK